MFFVGPFWHSELGIISKVGEKIFLEIIFWKKVRSFFCVTVLFKRERNFFLGGRGYEQIPVNQYYIYIYI